MKLRPPPIFDISNVASRWRMADFKPNPQGASFDLDASMVYWNGVLVKLSFTEFLMTMALRNNKNRIVSYEVLRRAAPGRYGPEWEDRIRWRIWRIRRKFKAVDPTFRRITTYHARGYSWREPEPEEK